ncbi:hypothetical protein Bca101_037129 [Brassica carinata]
MASPGAVVRKRGKMKGRQRVFRLHRCLHVSVISSPHPLVSVVASPRLRHTSALSLSLSLSRLRWQGGAASEAAAAKLIKRRKLAKNVEMDLKVRAGMEMAMIDAASKSVGVPLWKLFVVLKRNLSA